MAPIVALGQQHEFANAVSEPVGSVLGACPEIPQHAAEFLLSRPLFAAAGSTKSRLRDPFAQDFTPVLCKYYLPKSIFSRLGCILTCSARVLQMNSELICSRSNYTSTSESIG
jgi:hypothetical protein